MQAGMQVSSAIPFHVLLFSRVVIEKALSQIVNMEHIFSAKSIKPGQFCMFSHVWCCNASLNNSSFGTDITCNLIRHWFASS